MTPFPERPKPHFVQETRPGQDGFALIAVGTWGEQFTIDAEAVFSTFADANTEVNNYRLSPSLTPVNVVWNDVDIGATLNLQYFIQAVEITDQHGAVAVLRDGVLYSPAWVVLSRWTLLARVIP